MKTLLTVNKETMKKERDVKKRVKEILDEIGAWWFMPVQTGYGKAGVPDFIVCLKGRFIAIETKFGGGKLTALQRVQAEAINKAGGPYAVVDERTVGNLKKVLCS
jgi:hypothetical protein